MPLVPRQPYSPVSACIDFSVPETASTWKEKKFRKVPEYIQSAMWEVDNILKQEYNYFNKEAH
jgi:hypothetical protein